MKERGFLTTWERDGRRPRHLPDALPQCGPRNERALLPRGMLSAGGYTEAMDTDIFADLMATAGYEG